MNHGRVAWQSRMAESPDMNPPSFHNYLPTSFFQRSKLVSGSFCQICYPRTWWVWGWGEGAAVPAGTSAAYVATLYRMVGQNKQTRPCSPDPSHPSTPPWDLAGELIARADGAGGTGGGRRVPIPPARRRGRRAACRLHPATDLSDRRPALPFRGCRPTRSGRGCPRNRLQQVTAEFPCVLQPAPMPAHAE